MGAQEVPDVPSEPRMQRDTGVRAVQVDHVRGAREPADGLRGELGHSAGLGDDPQRLGDILRITILEGVEEKLLEMAKYATVPVINGLTDKTHPCQLMADVMTYEEHRGPIQGKAIAWSGDGNNMATSWIHAAVQFGFELRLACPEALIVVTSMRNEETKRKELTTFTYDTSRCMFCGLCEDACPVDALELTQDFEMATYTREGQIWDRQMLEEGPKPTQYKC